MPRTIWCSSATPSPGLTPDTVSWDYPPTNNEIRFDTVDMYRLRDGRLCKHWDVAGTRALFTQVGAITTS